MSVLPLANCSRLLGVHHRTLRRWINRASLELIIHPKDARVKCLTSQQLEQIAADHGLSLLWETNDLLAGGDTPREALITTGTVFQKLSQLEAKIAELSTHITDLSTLLHHEREHHCFVLGGPAECGNGQHGLAPSPTVGRVEATSAGTPFPPLVLIEAEQRARARRPAVVEFHAQGHYTVASPLDGELHLLPDSRAWFDWLATISSFRFVGEAGSFTAYREIRRKKQTRCWIAHRSLHGRHAKHELGVTDRLTTARMEQMAARLQRDLAVSSPLDT